MWKIGGYEQSKNTLTLANMNTRQDGVENLHVGVHFVQICWDPVVF